MQKNTEWNAEMKISLIIIDEEFMKRVKEGSEQATASMEKLRDNA